MHFFLLVQGFVKSKVHGRSSNLWTCVIPVLELIKYVILVLKLYLGLVNPNGYGSTCQLYPHLPPLSWPWLASRRAAVRPVRLRAAAAVLCWSRRRVMHVSMVEHAE